ncbi:hypothetical protein IWX90DRAFT_301091 [Phyllosticta citrichinensis]|uniref:Uncharacterized protein n=1 Tax=Phyllosticta citrichinensis TaxID=1130410 RepID=A0ABR1XKW2_9PEZI
MLGCSGRCMRPGQDAWRVKYEVVVENGTHGHGRRVVSSRAGKSAVNDDGDGEVACVPGWLWLWIFVCVVQTRSSPKHRRACRVERETWSQGQEAKKEIREGRDARSDVISDGVDLFRRLGLFRTDSPRLAAAARSPPRRRTKTRPTTELTTNITVSPLSRRVLLLRSPFPQIARLHRPSGPRGWASRISLCLMSRSASAPTLSLAEAKSIQEPG